MRFEQPLHLDPRGHLPCIWGRGKRRMEVIGVSYLIPWGSGQATLLAFQAVFRKDILFSHNAYVTDRQMDTTLCHKRNC